MEQSWDTAVAVATGELNAQEAFVTGQIRLYGDQQRLLDSQPVFGALDACSTQRASTPSTSDGTSGDARDARGPGPCRAADRAITAAAPQAASVPLTFTALKTAVPAPDDRVRAAPRRGVGRRGKFLLLDFEPVTFVVHLMQGGRLLVDAKQAAKPRGGQARFVFDEGAVPGAAAHRAGHRAQGRRVVRGGRGADVADRSTRSGRKPTTIGPDELAACSPATDACTGSSATSTPSPGSAAGSPTRCATGRSSRRSR